MGVLDGRRLKFTRDPERDDIYHVAAIASHSTGRVVSPGWIELGMVRRDITSTDSKVAGTRFRRPGKGRAVWRAVLRPQEGMYPRNELVGGVTFGGVRGDFRGSMCETRGEAAALLVLWADGMRREPSD